MRELTDSERKTRDKAWLECLGNRRERGVDIDFFEDGFIAALDHSAAQIAALTAERDALREALKPFAEIGKLEFLDHDRTIPVHFNYFVAARQALDNPTN